MLATYCNQRSPERYYVATIQHPKLHDTGLPCLPPTATNGRLRDVVASSCELRAPSTRPARLLLQCCVKSFFSQTSIWKRSCRLRKLCVAAETAHGRVAFASSGAASSTWMRGIPHLQPACQPLANLLESRASTIADKDGVENACSKIF